MTRLVRAVIAEDEPLARETLEDFLREVPWIELAGVAHDGEQAVALVDELRPELLFLDVGLPRCLGTTVLQRVTHRPQVVFITADEGAAVNAFDVDAVDFLLKPFGVARFRRMIERVSRVSPAHNERVNSDPRKASLVFAARRGRRTMLIPVEEIMRFAADGDYTTAYTEHGHRHFLDVTLAEIETQVGVGTFIRIHRSHLVRRSDIAEAVAIDSHRLRITLRDGTTLAASRAGSRRIRALLLT